MTDRNEQYFNTASALLSEFIRQGTVDGWKQSFSKLFLHDPELAAKTVRYALEKLTNKDLQRYAPLVALRYAQEDVEIQRHLAVAVFKQQPSNIKDSIQISRKWSREGFPNRGGSGAMLKHVGVDYVAKKEKTLRRSAPDVIKYLVTWLHMKPDAYMNQLFPTGKYAKREQRQRERSLYAKIKTLSPQEAAAFITKHKLAAPKILSALPSHVEQGKTEKGNPIFRNPYLLNEDFLFSFIERLSAKQTVIYLKMLEKHGINDSAKCRAALEKAKGKAEQDQEAAQRLTKAAEKVSSPTMKAQVKQSAERAFAQKNHSYSFQGKNVLLLTDKSGSMRQTIQISAPVAAYINKMGGNVLAVAFNDMARQVPITKEMTFEQIKTLYSRLAGDGGTVISVGFEYAQRAGFQPDIVLALTDGHISDNAPFRLNHYFPHNPMMVELHYGDGNSPMRKQFESSNLPYMYIEGNGLADSQLDNLLAGIRDNRFALVEEILALPFYTLDDL